MPTSPDPSHAPRPRLPRPLVPVLAALVIVAWQASFADGLPRRLWRYEIGASSGLMPDLREFFYFWHHLGAFPVGAHAVPRLGPARQDALAFVATRGRELRMDFGGTENTPRFGDWGKLFTLLPGQWLGDDVRHPSPRAFNAELFVIALVATWWAFWREGRALLGTLVVLLVGSDPFQLHETWDRANVFSLPISVALLALAAHVRVLAGRAGGGPGAWALAVAAGVALATVREIRTEAALVAMAVLATWLLARQAAWPRRVALVLAFLAAFALTGRAWTAYWNASFDRARAIVAKAGGVVYPRTPGTHHALWHALDCGLGDYGGDRGFAWDDRTAFRWAVTFDPRTNPHPLPFHFKDGYYFEETYDGVNRIAPTDLAAYNAKVRARVTDTIRAHPLWYARILGRRLLAILAQATPASIALGVAHVGLPGAGWLLVPVAVALAALRRRFELLLVLFTLPLGATALLVFSGRGIPYYGIAHLVALAVVLEALVAAARARAGRSATVAAVEPGGAST